MDAIKGILFVTQKQLNVFFYLWNLYIHMSESGSLAEFPECWVKPAAELSMSTSDAFTVPCSQPSEYFPKPSLAWLLHSASSQVFAVACESHTHRYLLKPPPHYSWTFLSTFLSPSWISPPCLLHHTVLPLAPSLSLSFFELLIFL